MSAAYLLNALLALAMVVTLAVVLTVEKVKTGEFGELTVVLFVAFVVSVIIGLIVPREHLLAYLIVLDGIIVSVMASYARRGSDQAELVLYVGVLKIAFTAFALSVGMEQHARAAFRNGGFLAQVLIAGGVLDGTLAWVGYRVRDLGLGIARMFNRVGWK